VIARLFRRVPRPPASTGTVEVTIRPDIDGFISATRRLAAQIRETRRTLARLHAMHRLAEECTSTEAILADYLAGLPDPPAVLGLDDAEEWAS